VTGRVAFGSAKGMLGMAAGRLRARGLGGRADHDHPS
jgi:hypothetical protein